jgi:hypothetical protein
MELPVSNLPSINDCADLTPFFQSINEFCLEVGHAVHPVEGLKN